MDTEKACEPLNRTELTDEQLKWSTAEAERREKESYINQILMDKKERRRAWDRQYRALMSDEQIENLNARARKRRALATDEQREKKRATERAYRNRLRAVPKCDEAPQKKRKPYCCNRWTAATDEEREKRNARYRELYVNATVEQIEKRKARRNKRQATVTDEEREKRNAYQRHRWATATDEQREKRKAKFRQFYANSTVEQREKRNAEARKKRADCKKREAENASSGEMNSKLEDKRKADVLESFAKATAEENEADPQYPFKIEIVDKNNVSYLGGGCIKPPDIVDKQFETSSTAKVEQCTSQIGSLDYFEVCEDWRTRVKIECNGEE